MAPSVSLWHFPKVPYDKFCLVEGIWLKFLPHFPPMWLIVFSKMTNVICPLLNYIFLGSLAKLTFLTFEKYIQPRSNPVFFSLNSMQVERTEVKKICLLMVKTNSNQQTRCVLPRLDPECVTAWSVQAWVWNPIGSHFLLKYPELIKAYDFLSFSLNGCSKYSQWQLSGKFLKKLKTTLTWLIRVHLKSRVHCFSMQVVLNKCFLLNPEKNMA